VKRGWALSTLGSVCTKIQDGAHQSPQTLFSEGGPGRFLYITSKNIRNDGLDLSNVSYVNHEFHNQIYPRCKPEVGDVLLTKDGANISASTSHNGQPVFREFIHGVLWNHPPSCNCSPGRESISSRFPHQKGDQVHYIPTGYFSIRTGICSESSDQDSGGRCLGSDR